MPNAPEPEELEPGSGKTEAKTEATVSGADPEQQRRFTAPGFDANETAIMATPADPATEIFASPPPMAGRPAHAAPPGYPAPPGYAGPPGHIGPPGYPAPPGYARPPGYAGLPPKPAVPQSIPPRTQGSLPASRQFHWGWVLLLAGVILILAAVAILGTALLTRVKHSKVSQEDLVRTTIQEFGAALQKGDLKELRAITCGNTHDGYVDYDENKWATTYQQVWAAKQYPVIASIDQVVVNGQHAEANLTTFMANDPEVRSTRSVDLQYRDDHWKICQVPSG